MILIDSRVGSEDMYAPLVQRGVECRLVTLPFGDLSFVGNGAHGPVAIGIERKRIRDLINSLMSGRLQGFQLPGCITQYDHTWLVVEGIWRTNHTTGIVEIPRQGAWEAVVPRIMGASLNGWLLTVQLRGGLRVHHTGGQYDTADWVRSLYHWWTAKEWEQHRGHLALYQPPDSAIFREPSLVQRVAALLPGIGEEKSTIVERHFDTVLEMACAGASTWQTIPGVGKLIAARAVEALQGSPVLASINRRSTPTSRRSVSSLPPTGTCSNPSSVTRSKKPSRSSGR